MSGDKYIVVSIDSYEQVDNCDMPAALDDDDDGDRVNSPDLLGFLDDFDQSTTAAARFAFEQITLTRNSASDCHLMTEARGLIVFFFKSCGINNY